MPGHYRRSGSYDERYGWETFYSLTCFSREYRFNHVLHKNDKPFVYGLSVSIAPATVASLSGVETFTAGSDNLFAEIGE